MKIKMLPSRGVPVANELIAQLVLTEHHVKVKKTNDKPIRQKPKLTLIKG